MSRRRSGLVPRIVRRDAARDLSASKRRDLAELGRRFTRGRATYVRYYWHPSHVEAILDPRSGLIEARRRAGWLSPSISAHQNKVCLETALGILRSSWGSAIKRSAVAIHRDSRFTSAERSAALRTINNPRLLRECLADGFADRCDPASRRFARRLKRIVLRSRGRMPTPRGGLWFDLDCNLYRAFRRDEDRHFRGSWVAITGLRPRQRIHVPLVGPDNATFASRTGRSTSGPNVRVVLVGNQVRFLVLDRVEPSRPAVGPAAGIDKGFNALVTLSTGTPEDAVAYGTNVGELTANIAESAIERGKQRRRIAAYERSLRNTDPRVSKRIRVHNLGAGRSGRRSQRDRAFLRQHVDASLNKLFRHKPPLSRLFCEDLTFRATPIARTLNRRLGRWLKGYLHKRLAYKAELNGVELTVVNAAYTSQSCPRCWFASKSNRRGERFECGQCAYTGSADAIAATNVLRRGSDPAITRFMSPRDVKQILEARWRSARNGRAWGSNEAVPAMGAPWDTDGGTSREQPAGGNVRGTGPHGGALSIAPLPLASLGDSG